MDVETAKHFKKGPTTVQLGKRRGAFVGFPRALKFTLILFLRLSGRRKNSPVGEASDLLEHGSIASKVRENCRGAENEEASADELEVSEEVHEGI